MIADALARIVRAREAIEDGDHSLAIALLTDLEADIVARVEREPS